MPSLCYTTKKDKEVLRMICGYPIWVVLLIGMGVFCAAFMDAIGGGGGIISVPVYLLAGLPTHYALGTNKLSSCLGTAASTFRYIKNGFVDWTLALPSVVCALVGAHAEAESDEALHEAGRCGGTVPLHIGCSHDQKHQRKSRSSASAGNPDKIRQEVGDR